MKELFLLVKKNITLLVRSKASALIVIFAPLLLILLIGLSYDNFSGYGLSVGFIPDAVGDDVNALQTSLEAQDFSVTIYNDLATCLLDIEQNYVHACVELPSDFSVQDNTAKTVTFHLDQSRINVVWIIQEVLRSEFSVRTQEVSEQLVADIFTQITTAQTELDSQRTILLDVQDYQSEVTSSLSSVNVTVTDDDFSTQDSLISTFENYVVGKAVEANDRLSELEAQVDSLDNITDSERSDLEDSVESAQGAVDQLEIYLAGTGDSSFGEIQEVISSLQTSLSSSNSGVDSANGSIAVAQSELDAVVSSLRTLSSSLGNFDVDDSSTISAPLVTNIELVSSEKSKFNYLFPSLVVLVIMFLSIMLGNTLVMMEKKSPAYVRNVLLPISKTKFIVANFLSMVVMVGFQTLILLLMSLLFVPGDMIAFLVIFITLLFAMSVFGLIGMVLGSLFSSEETSILASISTGALFLFLSGVILPIEGMSPGLRDLTQLNPFVIAEEVIRRVFVFGGSFEGLFQPYVTLILYSIILFLGIMVFDSFVHQHLVEKALYGQHKKIRRIREKKQEKIQARESAVSELGLTGVDLSDTQGYDKKSIRHSHGRKHKKGFLSKIFGRGKGDIEL